MGIEDKKLRFSAIDNVSSVVDRISSKFPNMTSAVKKTQAQMDRMGESSKKLNKNLSNIGSGMKSVGAGMTASLTLPIVAFGASAFKTTQNFDKSMNKVKALTGATGDAIAALEAEALKLGSTTSFSASQAADAMAFFGQAGWDTNQILAATGPTLDLAAASGTDLAMTADIMSNVMGGFNIKATEAAKVSDILAKATAKGNINMEMIGETMKDAAPVAEKWGASLTEVAALTAKLGDAGIQGSKAGTTLKNMFLNLASPTAQVKKVMQGLGVNVVDPATGKLRKMTDVLVDMNKAFKSKGINDAQKLSILNEVFGARAIAGAGVLINAVETMDQATGKTVNSIADLEMGLENSVGHAKNMADTMLENLPGAVTNFQSAWEGLQLAIMKSGLSEFLASVINKITSLFQWIINLNPTILKWAAILAGVVAVIGPLIAAMGIVISFLPMLINGFNALLVILPIIKGAVFALSLPFLKFIAIGALVVGAITLIASNWDYLVDKFKTGIDFISNLLSPLTDKIGAAVSSLGSFFGLKGSSNEETRPTLGRRENISFTPGGDETGSSELTKKNFEFLSRKQQASVDVKFSNLPKETRVMTDDRFSILNVDTGMMGAI